MSDIPSELHREILIHLPVEPLLRFRCVCKTWRCMIDDPDFVDLYLFQRNMHGEEDKMLTIATNTGKLYSFGLQSLNFPIGRRIKKIELSGINSACALRFPIPSCHRLILVSEFGVENVWALYNICTEEMLIIELPAFDNFVKLLRGYFGHGLGYVSSSDDHKVVRVLEGHRFPREDVTLTWIYSVKSRDWHIIENFPSSLALISKIGVFANGSLHWVGLVNNVTCIVALDLSTETYFMLHVPHTRNFPLKIQWIAPHLYALDGCLFFGAKDYSKFRVWILQDYRGENIWVKLVSMKLPFGHDKWDIRVVAYLKSKHQVLINFKNDKLVWFDVETKTCTHKITFMGNDGPFSCQAFPSSFMKRSNDRLPLKLRIPGSWAPWFE